MSAKRHYTIRCDGPGCPTRIKTNKSFVSQARDVAKTAGWPALGVSVSASPAGAVDFCSTECETRAERIHR